MSSEASPPPLRVQGHQILSRLSLNEYQMMERAILASGLALYIEVGTRQVQLGPLTEAPSCPFPYAAVGDRSASFSCLNVSSGFILGLHCHLLAQSSTTQPSQRKLYSQNLLKMKST